MTREELNYNKQKAINAQVRKNGRKVAFSILFKIIIFLILIGGSFFLLNKYIFTAKVIFKEERIINKKIPESFNGIKIIQFSDLHYGTTIFMDEVKELVESINERKPDLVFFTGDLIDINYNLQQAEQEELIAELSQINASIGKYAVYGENDKENFSVILNQSDFNILNNDYDLVYNNSDKPILIIGLNSLLTGNYDVSSAFKYFISEVYNSEIYTIALIHEPDLVTEFSSNYKVNLMLAGHSHNSSIRYPWPLEGSFNDVDGALTYSQPHYKIEEDSDLFISSGIGTNGNGIRFLSLPSVNFFRLSNK